MGRPLTLCCFVVLLATFALTSTAFEEDPEILANIAEGEALQAELNSLLGDSGVSNDIKVKFSALCLSNELHGLSDLSAEVCSSSALRLVSIVD